MKTYIQFINPLHNKCYTSMSMSTHCGIDYYSLAHEHKLAGEIDKMKFCYLKSIEQLNCNSMIELASYYRDIGKFSIAYYFYMIAYVNGYHSALFFLMELFKFRGEETQYSSELGNAYFQEAAQLEEAGNIENAKYKYFKSVEQNHSRAMLHLGIHYHKYGAHSLAYCYYTIALANGEKESLIHLAKLYIDRDMYDDMASCLNIATEHALSDVDHVWAIYYEKTGYVKDLEQKLGDVCEIEKISSLNFLITHNNVMGNSDNVNKYKNMILEIDPEYKF